MQSGVTLKEHAAARADTIIESLVPEYTSECAIYLRQSADKPCSSPGTIMAISETLKIAGSTPEEIIIVAKTKLNCTTEKCVLTKVGAYIGEQTVRGELAANFKIKGPIDNTLLSNVNIDTIMQQWMRGFPDFYAYNFNMLDYANYSFRGGQVLHQPDTLATVKFNGDIWPKYKCAGCVVNSDKYKGNGKHWMALFADARGDATWTVEFFNSSGNNPAPEWINWMQKIKLTMEAIAESRASPVKIEIIRTTTRRLQKSKSECGVYSLFYIWSRLNNIPYEYFTKHGVPDSIMFEFRHHLFESPTGEKFDWGDYQRRVKLKWESA